MAQTWDQIESVFSDALECPPERRSAFLDGACAGNSALRAEVESMLAAHLDDAALRIESRLLMEGVPASTPETDRSGEHAGAYRLLSRIGSGGMGDVYLAERDDDTYHRRVAVKLVRSGFPAPLEARFRRERDILARLDHPHIARLYDGGTTADGTPFLVMEHVDGVPITEHCDRVKMPVRNRLALFRLVCEAVQAAHVRLIVHRDLKPSNILVAKDGTPRLLDFGIARILDPEVEDSEPTRPFDRLMTPEHAAPEQIRGEHPSTATDVYALGVLLYELLTGHRPLQFPTRSPAEMERIVTESIPVPPSRFTMNADDRARIAEARGMDPARLARTLSGDLDAMTMTALRKEPERRYGTAGAFAADVDDFLAGRPVRARPDTFRYRTGKFLRRNRTAVTAAGIIAMLLVGFSIITARQSIRVAAERDQARIERTRAESVVDAMVRLFESTRPEEMPGGDTLRVSTFLERGVEMAGTFDSDAVRAELYEALGKIYRERGQFDMAGALMDSALASATEPGTRLRLQHAGAVITLSREGPAVAEPLLRESLETHRRLLGPKHPDVAGALKDLGDAVQNHEERRRLYLASLEIRRASLPPDDPAIASTLNGLGAAAIDAEQFDKAFEYLNEAAEVLSHNRSSSSPMKMTVDHNLAALHVRLGDWDRAGPVQMRILETKIRLYGAGTVPVAGSWEALGVTRANQGRLNEAAECFSNALAAFETSLAPDHWRVANAARNVGQLLALGERYREGLPYMDRAIDAKAHSGEDDRNRTYMRGQRAMMWLGLGEKSRALKELQRVEAGMEQSSGRTGASHLADIQSWLGIAWLENGKPGRAEPHFRKALELRTASLPEDHPKVAEARCGLGVSLAGLGRREEADTLLNTSRATFLGWGLAHPILRRHVESTRSGPGR